MGALTIAFGTVGAVVGFVLGGFSAYPNGNILLRAFGGAVLGAAILGGGSHYLGNRISPNPATDTFNVNAGDRSRVEECLKATPPGGAVTLSRHKDGTIGCTVRIP